MGILIDINFNEKFYPSKRLLMKYYLHVIIVLITIAIMFGGPIFAIYYALKQRSDLNNLYNTLVIVTYLIIAILASVVILYIYAYYKSIEYEVLENEIHVFHGIITKIRKIVPLRTITNLNVKRSIWDRMLGIGTIEVLTSATTTLTSEKINGIRSYMLLMLQELIINKVRGINGITEVSKTQLSPNQLRVEDHFTEQVIQEVKEINDLLTEHKDKSK